MSIKRWITSVVTTVVTIDTTTDSSIMNGSRPYIWSFCTVGLWNNVGLKSTMLSLFVKVRTVFVFG
jgi:hypothetical protein